MMDMIGIEPEMKKAKKLPAEVIVYTDGASRGNPGPASFGYVITNENGEVIKEGAEKLGEQTNNYAEYMAMIEALNFCKRHGAKKILIRADSQLMIRQMKGEYKVKAEGIIPLHQKAKLLASHFSTIHYEHIPREKNKEADRLANLALDS